MVVGLSVGYETWPPIGWHHPFVTDWPKYRLGLPQLWWTVGSCDQWEFPPFLEATRERPLTRGGYSLYDGWYICAAVLTPFFDPLGTKFYLFVFFFFSSTNTKIFWVQILTKFDLFGPKIPFSPRSFGVQFSVAHGTPPAIFGPSTPPGHWQHPCMALMAGKRLLLVLCKETVKESGVNSSGRSDRNFWKWLKIWFSYYSAVPLKRGQFSPKSSQQTAHSLPMRERYGVSVAILISDSLSATDITVYVISWWIRPRYNSTWLYFFFSFSREKHWEVPMDMIGVNTLGVAHYGQHFVIDIFKSILSKNISILLLCFHGSFFIYMKYILVPAMGFLPDT